MYDQFTDRSRKVMQLANLEAQLLGHEYIGTEHILLGLVKEGSGVAANVLKNLDIDLRKVRLEVEKIVGTDSNREVFEGKLPLAGRTKESLKYAIEEAKSLNHNYVGTEHLLLGLLREQESIAAQVLLNLGTSVEAVREEVLNLVGHQSASAPSIESRDVTSLFMNAWRFGTEVSGGQELKFTATYPFGELIRAIRQEERERCILMIEKLKLTLCIYGDMAKNDLVRTTIDGAIQFIKDMR